MSRREFLRIPRPKNVGIPIIDKEKCTGCGLCAVDCPAKALTVLQSEEGEIYQILLRQGLCNACGICEKTCPENCLELEKGHETDKKSSEVKVIFEDRISRCSECGTLLFPHAMIEHLKNRGCGGWLDLCPSCKMKTQFGKEKGPKR